MRNVLRFLISMLLAALMTLQCFAAAVPLDLDADPVETAENSETTPAPEPERNTPYVSAAQVRPEDSEAFAELTDGIALDYNAAVLHFVFASEAGESAEQTSGVDLAACAVYVDERLMSEAIADKTDCSLTLPVTFPNGRHVLRVLARDSAGGESENVYTLQVNGSSRIYPTYSVNPDGNYAPLGGTLKLVVHTSNAAYLDTLNVCIRIDPSYAPAYQVEAGQGFTLIAGSESFDETTGELRFRVKTNVNLSGERDAAAVIFSIDRETPEGTELRYAVPGVWAETRRADTPNYVESFSLAEQAVPVESPLLLSVDPLCVGDSGTASFRVTDRGNRSLSDVSICRDDGTLIGITNWSGQLTVPAGYRQKAGTFTAYAEKSGVGVSFPQEIQVRAAAGADVDSGLVFQAVPGAVNSKTGMWISGLYNDVYYRYYDVDGSPQDAEILKADYSRVPMGSMMVQVNRVTLTNLDPDCKYCLEVSYDRTNWSVKGYPSFVPSDRLMKSTSFFVMGDLAGASSEEFSRKWGSIRGSFGVFTGNLMSDVTDPNDWNTLLSRLNYFGDRDLLFVPGEKELADGGSVFQAVTGQPEGCFSYETGLVYIAVIPYRENQDYSADLAWLEKDASRTSCPWKMLVTHQPVYAASAESAGLETTFPQVLERAGIQFVFSGHDQVYARTPALKGGKTAESYDPKAYSSNRGDGVVYYICGSLTVNDQKFTQEMPEGTLMRDYEVGISLRVQATEDSCQIYTEDLDGFEKDHYTMYASSCVKEGHLFSESSLYDHSEKTLVCDRCGRAVPKEQINYYTGFVSLKPSGRAYLNRGSASIGWFTVDDVPYHAGDDARIHQTEVFTTATCTTPGQQMGWCTECGGTYALQITAPATGHDYDENHRCKNIHYDSSHHAAACGWTAQNIAELDGELEYLYGFCTGAALTPAVTIRTSSGDLLDESEYTVAYVNNVKLGVASAVITAVNSYYGTKTLNFEIRPNEVKSLKLEKITSSSVTFSWSEAEGAQRYVVYQQTGDTWKRLGDTDGLSYTVSALSPGTEYVFRVRPYATVTDTAKRLDGSTDRTYWAPHYSESLKVATEGIAFVDVPEDSWYAAAVNWAVGANVTQGTGDNRFSPSAQCTRGQMVTFLWRAKGCPEPMQTQSPFTDVSDPKAYYYKAVLWAVEKGITRGSSTTTFSPNAPVTRGMVVTFLHRSAGNTAPASSTSPFVDVESWQYYAQSVQWAVEKKITSGMDATHFSPDTICTRAQIVTFLYRLETGG